jgi:PTH1 family peptidyl-tRNA hydrolase
LIGSSPLSRDPESAEGSASEEQESYFSAGTGMKLMVGLGNPGVEYQNTRHNLGFEVIDRIARRSAPGIVAKSKFHGFIIETDLAGEKLLLLRPSTYMNRSGTSVAEIVNFYKLNFKDDLLVMTDDVALPPGAIRLRASGSAGGHNGLADIETRLGSDEYARLRIGIGTPAGTKPQKDHVLGYPTSEERELIESALEQAVEAAMCWAREGISTAMNRYNRRSTGVSPDAPNEASIKDSTTPVRK